MPMISYTITLDELLLNPPSSQWVRRGDTWVRDALRGEVVIRLGWNGDGVLLDTPIEGRAAFCTEYAANDWVNLAEKFLSTPPPDNWTTNSNKTWWHNSLVGMVELSAHYGGITVWTWNPARLTLFLSLEEVLVFIDSEQKGIHDGMVHEKERRNNRIAQQGKRTLRKEPREGTQCCY